MADHVMESRVWLARSRPEVFAFFADPRNLVQLMPPSLRLRIVTPTTTLAAGVVLDLRVAWLGIPVPWRVYIREYDPPYRFVDVQVRGPWARWENRHLFLEEDGGTWVEDRLTYRPPLGPLGRLAHSLALERQLRALWAYRQRRLGELLAPAATPGPSR
jgi:ligand-binding SRPBCC domain-containing protein